MNLRSIDEGGSFPIVTAIWKTGLRDGKTGINAKMKEMFYVLAGNFLPFFS